MRIAVPKEVVPGVQRAALSPDAVSRLARKGFTVALERGAGASSFLPDADYERAGAVIEADVRALWRDADLVAKIAAPAQHPALGVHEAELLRPGATLVCELSPLTELELVARLAKTGARVLALDMIPRITRAQSMDTLSSMATLVGYKAGLLAASAAPRILPMMTTAAGTLPPAKVFIIGCGVAGLQAIATTRRLGAIVQAFDTRPAVKEQVQSLGARFVEFDLGVKDAETKGGYAKALTPEQLARQRELMTKELASCDVVILAALVQGRRAPVLVTSEMVRAMRPGAVIVDLAAGSGGNCELTEAGATRVEAGVTIVGTLNLADSLPMNGTQMFGRNVATLLEYLHQPGSEGEAATLRCDPADEIVAGCLITRDGRVVHDAVRRAFLEREPALLEALEAAVEATQSVPAGAGLAPDPSSDASPAATAGGGPDA